MVFTPLSNFQKIKHHSLSKQQRDFFWKHKNYKAYLCLTTDDILFSSENKILNEIFEQEIGEFFTYQVQKGSVLKYLNWQIIQSKHGISIDQKIRKNFPSLLLYQEAQFIEIFALCRSLRG